MLLDWFNTREAATVGAALAEDLRLPPASAPRRARAPVTEAQRALLNKLLQEFLQRVDREALSLRLNTLKRATLANTFRWRLIEKGVEPDTVAEFTRALVLRLTTPAGGTQARDAVVTAPPRRPPRSPACPVRAVRPRTPRARHPILRSRARAARRP